MNLEIRRSPAGRYGSPLQSGRRSAGTTTGVRFSVLGALGRYYWRHKVVRWRFGGMIRSAADTLVECMDRRRLSGYLFSR